MLFTYDYFYATADARPPSRGRIIHAEAARQLLRIDDRRALFCRHYHATLTLRERVNIIFISARHSRAFLHERSTYVSHFSFPHTLVRRAASFISAISPRRRSTALNMRMTLASLLWQVFIYYICGQESEHGRDADTLIFS